MNLLSDTGNADFVPFTEDDSTPEFWLDGPCSFEVPTAHAGNTEDLGGGTLSLEISTDNGTSWRIYTDSQGTPASLTSTGVVLPFTLLGPHYCRVTLTDSTSPDITAVILHGDFSLTSVAG